MDNQGKSKSDEPKKKPKTPHLNDDQDLDHFELSGDEDTSMSPETSETDDDENEGMGDGKIGRSVKDDL